MDLHEKSATEIAGLISLSRNQLYQLYKKENISEKHVNKLQSIGIDITNNYDSNILNDPQEKYNAANAPRPDYLILSVLEKSLREQAALTQIQTQTAQIIKLIAAKFLTGNDKKQLEGVDLKFTTSVKQSKTHNH